MPPNRFPSTIGFGRDCSFLLGGLKGNYMEVSTARDCNLPKVVCSVISGSLEEVKANRSQIRAERSLGAQG